MTQKKTQIGMLAAILLSGIFASCTNKGENVVVADNETEVVVDTINTLPEYKYAGREHHIAAVYKYLVDSVGSKYTQGDICIPQATIVKTDETNSNDILVWGDFWVFNYKQVGDTLKCVSGGSHPGLLHIRQTEKGFEVMAFDQVEDGSRYLPTAKKIFGDKYDAFQAINSDEKNRERLRAEVLATYAKKNGLAVTLYQDYGWPAKEIPAL